MNRIKISFIINIIIALLTIIASIIMFSGFKFMGGNEIVLESTSIGMFRFFTVDSNLFIGIISFIYALEEYKIIKKIKKEISKKLIILKYMATVSVGLTFFVVFAYLGPISNGGVIVLLKNSNLFFHLIIPLLSILNFIIFERNNKLNFKDTLYGLVPTILYEIYYLFNVLIHMENGKVLPKYDWYYFVQNGIWTAFIVAPLMILITYIISLIIWKVNHSKKVD